MSPHRKVGLALVGAAGVLAVIGSWLPWISTEFGITDSTFTANGFAEGEEGWWTASIGVLLLVVLLLDRIWREQRTALGVLVIAASLGCGLITLTDYQETQQRGVPGTRRALLDAMREGFEEQQPLGTFDVEAAEEILGFRGGPGTGTWTLFLASGLGTIGGILLVATRSQPSMAARVESPRETQIDSKVCPRCAETVKAAAQVCRFCGHEFTASE